MSVKGERDERGTDVDEKFLLIQPDYPKSISEVQERAFGVIDGIQEEIELFKERGLEGSAKELENALPVARVVIGRLGLRARRGSD